MKPMLFALTLALLAAPVFAADEVYRWVDADGRVHFADSPPPGIKAERIASAHANAASDEAATKDAAANDAASGNDPVDKEMKALLAQRCTTAKAVAARYEKAPYLQMKAADGTLTRMSPEDEARERLRIKDEVTTACGTN